MQFWEKYIFAFLIVSEKIKNAKIVCFLFLCSENGNCEDMFVCIFIFEKLHFAIVFLCCCVLKMETVIFLYFSKS